MSSINDQDYIINVGPGGTFQPSGQYQTSPQQVDQIFRSFEQRNERKIAIYFHGGLVNETAGLAGARNMAPHIQNGGCAPICFVWETGLLETVSSNLIKIRQTKLFDLLLKAMLKKISEKIGISDPGGRGAGVTGLTNTEIQTELSSPTPFEHFERTEAVESARGIQDIDGLVSNEIVFEAQLVAEFRRVIEADTEFLNAISQTTMTVSSPGTTTTGARGIISTISFVTHAAKIAYRIIKRFVQNRDHGFYPTVVEEILREFYIAELGAWIWNAMKIKAADMWKDNSGRQGADQYAGRYFLDKLITYKATYPDTQVSLIGHSAGSIAISELLDAASTSNIEWNHITLLAPACRIDLFQRALVNYPQRFKDVRIFTMSDEYERRDLLVPFVYTRSLLYLISGILEDEGKSFDAYILGLERHIRFQTPYDIDELKVCHNYIYQIGLNRVSFAVSTTTTAGMTTTATKHGDFDDDPATLRSIEWILNQ